MKWLKALIWLRLASVAAFIGLVLAHAVLLPAAALVTFAFLVCTSAAEAVAFRNATRYLRQVTGEADDNLARSRDLLYRAGRDAQEPPPGREQGTA
jgi:hypothetical protein